MITALYRRYDRLPEPRRMLSFLAVMAVVLCSGTIINLFHFGYGYILWIVCFSIMLPTRIWYLHRKSA